MTESEAEKKVVLVTGASSGIGKAIALKLLDEGYVVYGAARRVEKMQELIDAGGHAWPLDVTDHNKVRLVAEHVVRESGRIDVLVNNAGYATYGSVEDTTIDDARRQFEVNLFGLAALTREVLPFMRKQGSGKIVNISSMGGKIYTPLGAWYHATKHAVEGWSDCLRLEVGRFGIDVIIIEPGIIATEFSDVLTGPMLQRSGSGPYASLANSIAERARKGQKKRGGSPPSIIGELVAKALAAEKPKTRYAAGKFAKPLMWLRKWGGDRLFDRAVMSQIKGK